MGGKSLLLESVADRFWPSSTSLDASAMASAIRVLLTTFLTMERAVSIGTPLSRSVPRVRLKRATAILWVNEPKSGIFSLILSQRYCPLRVFVNMYLNPMKLPMIIRTIAGQKDFRKPLMEIRKIVIPGRVWCISLNMPVIFGTIKVVRKKRTILPIRNMNMG